ncbi:hypothetical protein BX661DRAFT_179814 [Kickxella alabastrina]|uniref:uncharacterized protein n=1 Tax=Kickxella alabastrina TaxID=61397 RepID=UPI00222041B6|nr:uncharacterized protein BX661DRAFT_179814 [Kickxella alabastrina]KAI7832104.1 hypothetical protein BX661DRAFT_179814 [Kickxella alabastrina]KAJ1946771.1 hypothetical protein GGF37_000952 [Kickxella alabastrina]
MVSLPGSTSVWWYGRAIRLYFLLSFMISALWIVKVLYIDSSSLGMPFMQSGPPNSNSETAAAAAAAVPSYHRYTFVDESSLQLPEPAREYTLAYTDHIYCLNQKNRLGRKGRMSELFRYMHLNVQIFDKSQATHMDIWRDMINRGYERALVLEDDIDFEVDAVSVIGKAINALNATSANWDILHIGHCSAEEGRGKAKTAFDRVHRSVHPFCTSGYVLSRNGAQKLFAYFVKNSRQSRALDVQIVALIKRKMLSAFSVHPPVVYQRRDLYPTDDGVELKVFKLFKNSAWDEAREFVPRLANWADPLDVEFVDPAYKQIPSWMEDTKTIK